MAGPVYPWGLFPWGLFPWGGVQLQQNGMVPMSVLQISIQTARPVLDLQNTFEINKASAKHEVMQKLQQFISSVQTGTESGPLDVGPPNISLAVLEAAVAAIGTLTFDAVVAGDTFVINGITYTGVAAITGNNQFLIGGTDAETAANAADAIVESINDLTFAAPVVDNAFVINGVLFTMVNSNPTVNQVVLGHNLTFAGVINGSRFEIAGNGFQAISPNLVVNTTAGSNFLSSVIGISTINIGDYISCDGVTFGTRVTAIDLDNGVVTLSAPATSTNVVEIALSNASPRAFLRSSTDTLTVVQAVDAINFNMNSYNISAVAVGTTAGLAASGILNQQISVIGGPDITAIANNSLTAANAIYAITNSPNEIVSDNVSATSLGNVLTLIPVNADIPQIFVTGSTNIPAIATNINTNFVTAIANGTVISITALYPGILGNLVTITGSTDTNITASGTNLELGTNDIEAISFNF